MKRTLLVVALVSVFAAVWVMAQPPAGDPIVEGFRNVEAASVSDAMEQVLGQKNYMSHEMRPLFTTRFVGPAVTVLLKREEHKEGSAASNGMLEAIDAAPAGSVYVMAADNALDFGLIGALMGTAMRVRGLAGAVVDGGIRDTPQLRRIQFPVFSRGVAPSTTINHFRFGGANVPVTIAGVRVNGGDYIVADEDGVVVVPKARAAEILKKSQELDDTEHRMLPFIEKFKSITEAVKQFGRI